LIGGGSRANARAGCNHDRAEIQSVTIRAVDRQPRLRNAVRMAVRSPTNLSLPADLVAEVDAIAGRRNRSAFVEQAIRARLKRERLRLAMDRARGTISVEEYPEFATSEGVVEWVRDRRRETTSVKPGAEWSKRHP
jgi:predicted transcriptional regulator